MTSFLNKHEDKWQPEPNSGCYIWTASLLAGYAGVWHDGKMRKASRIVCEETYGPAPADKPEAAHSCANTLCINDTHLRWASKEENEADKKRSAHRYVTFNKRTGKWSVRLDSSKHNRAFVGNFYTLDAAVKARDEYLELTNEK